MEVGQLDDGKGTFFKDMPAKVQRFKLKIAGVDRFRWSLIGVHSFVEAIHEGIEGSEEEFYDHYRESD